MMTQVWLQPTFQNRYPVFRHHKMDTVGGHCIQGHCGCIVQIDDIDNTNKRNYYRNVNLKSIEGLKLCHANDMNNCCLIDFKNYGNVRIHVS